MGCLFGWVLIFYWLSFFSYWELRHGHNGEKYYAALVYK